MQKGKMEKVEGVFSDFSGETAAPPAKNLSVLAGGVIGVKQTVFNTQELELPRSFGRWILIYLVIR